MWKTDQQRVQLLTKKSSAKTKTAFGHSSHGRLELHHRMQLGETFWGDTKFLQLLAPPYQRSQLYTDYGCGELRIRA